MHQAAFPTEKKKSFQVSKFTIEKVISAGECREKSERTVKTISEQSG
jgi:hypothetical protein